MDLSEAIRVGYERVDFVEGKWFSWYGKRIHRACPMGAAYLALNGQPRVSLDEHLVFTQGAKNVLIEAYPWLEDMMPQCCPHWRRGMVIEYVMHMVDEHRWFASDVRNFADNYTRAGGAK